MGITRVLSDSPLLVRGIEVKLSGALIGAVVPVPMPGQEPENPFNPVCQYVGWTHDWDGDSESYDPICLGVSDDPESLFAEIERRAREATV